jgi:hypothetical protein
VLEKITYAGTASRSFLEASAALHKLAELAVPEKQVERVTRRIGAERVAERDGDVVAFQALPLVEKFAVPVGVTPPDLAVVMTDGGRLQIRDGPESTPAQPALESSTAAALPAKEPNSGEQEQPAALPAEEPNPGQQEQSGLESSAAAADSVTADEWEEEETTGTKKGHWREDKIGLLLTMKSSVSETDPCPDIPESFVDALRIPKLVRELKKNVAASQDTAADAPETEGPAEALQAEAKYEPPKVQQRKVTASRACWPAFAPMLAAAARALGFQGAARKAFVGDGSANNWTLQRRFFGSFVPILDFIHALSYVFAAAMAGKNFALGWTCYQQWIRWVWQGQVALVIAALETRQAEVGLPAKDESETSPRVVVDRTLRYLRNHQDKMHYDQYRQQGLPITSSHVESVVKQINQRVKGTEKFWSEEGSEAVLQLRADYLSDGQPLETFWQRRQAAATGQRRYRRAG